MKKFTLRIEEFTDGEGYAESEIKTVLTPIYSESEENADYLFDRILQVVDLMDNTYLFIDLGWPEK